MKAQSFHYGSQLNMSYQQNLSTSHQSVIHQKDENLQQEILFEGIQSNTLHMKLKSLLKGESYNFKHLKQKSSYQTIKLLPPLEVNRQLLSLSNSVTPVEHMVIKTPNMFKSPIISKTPNVDINAINDQLLVPSHFTQGKQDLWQEIKVKGRQIQSRSSHSTVYFEQKVFLYGGKDHMKGSFGDLKELAQQGPFYFWRSLPQIDTIKYLSDHLAILNDNLMYIYGGSINPLENSNKLHSYNLIDYKWQLIDVEGDEPLKLDGHSGCSYQNKLYIFGGFQTISDPIYTNTIQIYDTIENNWEIVKNDAQKQPQPRSNHASVLSNDILYIHGGRNEIRLDDLWKYNLTTRQWSQIKFINKGPEARCGHQLLSYDNFLLVFGGYCGLLKETNDLWLLNISKREWICLESGLEQEAQQRRKIKTTAGIYRKDSISIKPYFNIQKEIPPQTKLLVNLNQSKASIRRNSSMMTFFNYEEQKDYGTDIDLDTRLKRLKKNLMLEPFKSNQDELRKFLVTTPTTNKMSYAIENTKISLIKTPKFEKSIVEDNKRGRPLPRNNFSMVATDQGWLMIGGDRHQASFNDVWLLNKKAVEIYQ